MGLAIGQSYVVDLDFTAESETELTVRKGDFVKVLEIPQESSGWVLVESSRNTGYIPVSYLDTSLIRAAQLSSGSNIESASQDFSHNSTDTALEFDGKSRVILDTPPRARGLDDYNQDPFQQSLNHIAQFKGEHFSGKNGELKSEWIERDKSSGGEYFPSTPTRRWFYRDIFNDLQGPFNAEEMKQRLDANFIKSSTSVLIEVGTGAANSFYEDSLDNLFTDKTVAFLRPPSIAGTKSLWYFVDSQRYEQGPFSTNQMKLWFDQGYFSSFTSVRLADDSDKRKPLYEVFEDPLLAFASASESFQNLNKDQDAKPQLSGKDLLQSVLTSDGTTLNQLDDKAQKVAESGSADLNRIEEKGSESVKDMGKVYGQGWNEFSDIPSPNKTANYASALYTFLTRPLNPEAGIVKCNIIRDVEGAHLNYNKYTLFLEKEGIPVLVAYRHYHTLSNYYDIKLNNTGKVRDNPKGLTIAHVEASIGGTEFLLHNNVPGHSGKARDMCCVLYERTRGLSGSAGPRKMRAAIPKLSSGKPEFELIPHNGKKKASITQALAALDTNKVIPLLNKPPKWNPKRGAYTLEFKGRAKVSSVFQLVDALNDPEHQNILMTFGKASHDKFNMDTRHPMSVLQAFAIALSSLHSKKLVE